MTLEQQEMLEREMKDALALTDADRRNEAVQTVTLHYLAALCDCQRKTAARVKEMVAAEENRKAKMQGAVIMWRIIRYAVASGAGAVLFKLLQGGIS